MRLLRSPIFARSATDCDHFVTYIRRAPCSGFCIRNLEYNISKRPVSLVAIGYAARQISQTGMFQRVAKNER